MSCFFSTLLQRLRLRCLVSGGVVAILGLGMWAAKAEAAPPSLVQAYKKEYAFLQAQKASLTSRLVALKRRTQSRVSRAAGNLRAMQGTLLSINNRMTQLQQDMAAAERANSVALAYKDELEKLAERVTFGLNQKGVKLPKMGDSDEDASKVPPAKLFLMAFQKAANLLERSGKIEKKQGSFFLPNGAQTEGTLVNVGGIASYGVSTKGQGALAPAGANRLKLWPKPASGTANALAKGQTPLTLNIFLYETLEKEIAWKAEKSLYEFVNSGGVIGWVIVGLGLAALLMVLLRILILWWASSNSSKLMGRLEPLLQSGQQEEALDVCKRSGGAMARVLQKVVLHMHKPRQQQEELVAEAVMREAPAIERFGMLIGVCAAVAPLLGLLGTVTGMISTFDVITEYGTGDPKMLAGGISEALVTTQLGLVVAIPALLLGSLLSGRAESILTNMEWGALRLMNLLGQSSSGGSGNPQSLPSSSGYSGGSVVGSATPRSASQTSYPSQPAQGLQDLSEYPNQT